MTTQDLRECIAEVKYSDIPDKSKKLIMDVLYEKKLEVDHERNTIQGKENR